MQLKDVSVTNSAETKGRIKLVGEVIYDGPYNPELYWFEFPEKYSRFLSKSGNLWLACLLPLAVKLGEPLRIQLPVDRILYKNVHILMKIWKLWYPSLHIVPVEVIFADRNEQETGNKTAAFFSGGVDSFFTVLQNDDKDLSKNNIDDLIYVHGFNLPHDNNESFERMGDILRGVASDFGKELVVVSTNIRKTTWGKTDWAFHSHNCLLASVAHTLENRYDNVFIPSSGGYHNDLRPWGSHVITDPLLSSGKLNIVHDGAKFLRIEKTELVSKSEVALRSLMVCYKSGSESNCCSCSKCYRTMIALELYGVLNRCSTFKQSSVNVEKIKKIFLADQYENYCFQNVRKLAEIKGRDDIVNAIDYSFKNSRRIKKWLHIIRSFQSKHFIWRWVNPLESFLLRDVIR